MISTLTFFHTWTRKRSWNHFSTFNMIPCKLCVWALSRVKTRKLKPKIYLYVNVTSSADNFIHVSHSLWWKRIKWGWVRENQIWTSTSSWFLHYSSYVCCFPLVVISFTFTLFWCSTFCLILAPDSSCCCCWLLLPLLFIKHSFSLYSSYALQTSLIVDFMISCA